MNIPSFRKIRIGNIAITYFHFFLQITSVTDDWNLLYNDLY